MMFSRKLGMIALAGLLAAGLAGCSSPKVSTTDSADQKIDISSFRLMLDHSVYSYSGKAIKPAVKVLSEDNEALDAKDYSIAYSNNTNIGTATIKVKGVKTYEGALTKHFTIVKDAKKLDQTAFSNTLDEIISFDAGESGTSMKVTMTAVNLLDYAQSVNMAKVKEKTLKKDFDTWYAKLDKEQKKSAEDNLETVTDTADGIIANIKDYQDELDDAGVSEQAKRVMKVRHVKKDWRQLKKILDRYD